MTDILDPNEKQELEELANHHFGFTGFLKRNKIAVAIACLLVVALSSVALIILREKPGENVVSNNVLLSIKGPGQLSGGNEAEYRIIYRNGENADLVDVSLELYFPSGLKFKSSQPAALSSAGMRYNLPLLKSGENAEVMIKVQLSGATAEEKIIAAKLTYKLANFNSQFEVRNDYKTLILAPSVTLEINGPIEVISGQDTSFSVVFQNVSGHEFENLTLKLTYPESFSTQSKDYWLVPRLGVNERLQVDVSGAFIGEISSQQSVVAELGQLIGGNPSPLLTASGSFKLTKAQLALNVTSDPDDFIKLGDNIQINLKYENLGVVDATNVQINLSLESIILDLSKINVYNAIVSGNTVSWKSATLQNLSTLSPNQKGEITLSVPIKTTLATNLKNQSVRIIGTIKSDQMPKIVRSEELALKLASEMDVLISGEYVAGALPMKVGQQTTFALTFLLTNLSNDLESVEVVSSLPLPQGSWNGVVIPESEKENLLYDSNSGKIRWRIGSLPAFSGKYSPARKATFQLTVVPTDADRNRVVRLLSDIQASGTDAFTNQNVSAEAINEVTTATLGDYEIDQKGASVQ
ncbi:MAG: hypothetical protein A2720_00395 [Candidatus Doudnabacteria bacterium RIFCSPHIGHO2_01_FULL_46_24]|uniref:DUF11 domain-containing protein n=1 Tax=Candidatus Doudnabacteria bacterium RIFCSPHIGHO2_01_FULL_46_24 TaxID=1817825 RepID=A0A1F5NTB2_9BACT|nr:MAG: hypothetical protein A2720_00395 [Candidatus Doudnabacteria bacterium RIFCSPHIGHO2_01_FULL_46_24]